MGPIPGGDRRTRYRLSIRVAPYSKAISRSPLKYIDTITTLIHLLTHPSPGMRGRTRRATVLSRAKADSCGANPGKTCLSDIAGITQNGGRPANTIITRFLIFINGISAYKSTICITRFGKRRNLFKLHNLEIKACNNDFIGGNHLRGPLARTRCSTWQSRAASSAACHGRSHRTARADENDCVFELNAIRD